MQHLTQKQLEDYAQSQLVAAELLTVTDHLSECETCRHRLHRGFGSDNAFLSLHSEILNSSTESCHLSPDQAANYVDKALSIDELQTANDHLITCDLCNLTIKDLQTFRNEIAPSIDHEYGPANATEHQSSWWHRTSKSFPAWFQFPLPALTAGALALLVFAGFGWVLWRNRSAHVPKEEIAVVPSPSPQMSLVKPAPSPEMPQQDIAELQLSDGGRQLTLNQTGSLTGVEDLPTSQQVLIKRTLTTGRIERSAQLNGLTRPGSTLMSSDKTGATFSIKDPIGSVQLNDRPTFRWSKLEGVSSYSVEIYDDKFELVLQSPPLSGESWTATKSLPRGAVYNWQVKATKQGEQITSPRPPAAQARFRILDQARAGQIARARQAGSPSHLTLALLYADAGLLDEAMEQLRQLQKENPNSRIVSDLLKQVEQMKRRR